MKASILTIGCKLNQAESDLIRYTLESQGYKMVNLKDKPDLCIINTCTVTHRADRSSINAIRKATKLLPSCKVVVTGCMVETQREKISSIEGVEVLPLSRKEDYMGDFYSPLRNRLFLKIQDGCDRNCTYCVVSRIRGNPTSKPFGKVLDEFKKAIQKGFEEVVVVGVNIGLWGKEFGGTLLDLLKAVSKLPNVPRIRLSSLQLDFFTPEFFTTITKLPICRHLHLSLQHTEDEILKLMGRGYRKKEIYALFEKLSKYFPKWNIGADVIVGFPGETSYLFENMVTTLEDSPISYLHVFSYSDRPLTPAFKFTPKTPQKIIKERNKILREVGKRKNFTYRKLFDGCLLDTVKIAVKRALSDNYIHIELPYTPTKNRFITKLTKITEDKTYGISVLKEV